MKLGDLMLTAICGLVIAVSIVNIDKHYSTSNVEQQKAK